MYRNKNNEYEYENITPQEYFFIFNIFNVWQFLLIYCKEHPHCQHLLQYNCYMLFLYILGKLCIYLYICVCVCVCSTIRASMLSYPILDPYGTMKRAHCVVEEAMFQQEGGSSVKASIDKLQRSCWASLTPLMPNVNPTVKRWLHIYAGACIINALIGDGEGRLRCFLIWLVVYFEKMENGFRSAVSALMRFCYWNTLLLWILALRHN